jgi:antibiotic biosynthesis monooxygenase (ABM) superfamily enzyme
LTYGNGADAVQRNGKDTHNSLTMAVRHFVKWEYELEFLDWTREIDAEMAKYEGYLGMVRIPPRTPEEPHVNCFTYDSYEHLLQFQQSARRRELLLKLEPMLSSVSTAQLSDERAMYDAFTELFVPTGGCAAPRPPPVWKSTILTIVPLFIIVWQEGGNLNPYIYKTKIDFFLALFFTVCVSVTVSTYVGVPLMQSQFGAWLHHAPSRPSPTVAPLLYAYPQRRQVRWLGPKDTATGDGSGMQAEPRISGKVLAGTGVPASSHSTYQLMEESSLSAAGTPLQQEQHERHEREEEWEACTALEDMYYHVYCGAVFLCNCLLIAQHWAGYLLDAGFPLWGQCAVVAVYFGLNILFGALRG